MNFCVQILNTPAEKRDPRQKDGILHIIGTLSDILLKVQKFGNWAGGGKCDALHSGSKDLETR